jgi:hypothetical protein
VEKMPAVVFNGFVYQPDVGDPKIHMIRVLREVVVVLPKNHDITYHASLLGVETFSKTCSLPKYAKVVLKAKGFFL